MIRKLQHVFALSEKGARDFVKAVAWCFLCNVSLTLPVGVVMSTIQHLLETLETTSHRFCRKFSSKLERLGTMFRLTQL